MPDPHYESMKRHLAGAAVPRKIFSLDGYLTVVEETQL